MKISKILQKSIFYTLLLLIGISVRAMDVLDEKDIPKQPPLVEKPALEEPTLEEVILAKAIELILPPTPEGLPKATPSKPVSPKLSKLPISKAAPTKKKKKRRRKKKKAAKAIIAVPKAPPIYTFETSPSKSADGSFLRQETADLIEIFDTKNLATIRLYKIAPVAQARPERIKFLPFTINAQAEPLKSGLSKTYKNMQPAKRVKFWFTRPQKALQQKQKKIWDDIYYAQPEAVINPEVAADKELKRLFGITVGQIYDTKRALTDQENWTIKAHNFTKLVDKYIPAYAVYSTREIPKGQVSFLIPGELNNEPVVFEYTIDPKKIKGQMKYQLYHRFAARWPRDKRVQHLLIEAWNKLHPESKFT